MEGPLPIAPALWSARDLSPLWIVAERRWGRWNGYYTNNFRLAEGVIRILREALPRTKGA